MKKILVLVILAVMILTGSLAFACCPIGQQVASYAAPYCAPAAQVMTYQPVAVATTAVYAYPVAVLTMPATTVVQAQQQVAAPQQQLPLPAPQPVAPPVPQVEQVQAAYTPAPVVVRQVQQVYAVPQANVVLAQGYGYGHAAGLGYGAGAGVVAQRNVVIQRNVVRRAPPVVVRQRNVVVNQRTGFFARLRAGRAGGARSSTTVIVR